ncbi:MAG: DUF5696 domain-containing protein [Verrucomicrobiota bacterium]
MKHILQTLGGLCACLITVPLGAATNQAVTLGSGETRLSDIGIYRVGYQSYGKEPVLMPDSWAGHFDDATGISYQPGNQTSGRDALLMHSPWRIPPGRTWVEYRLQLPPTKPIRLMFGIALPPDCVGSNKSDGVTFSGYLSAGGAEKELLRRHYLGAEWQDYSFDLSPYAGQPITLRLQVEPGPKNNAAFDLSLFGSAKIVAGDAGDSARELVTTITSTKAYRAVAQTSLKSVANQTNQGIIPSNLLPCKNQLIAGPGNHRFIYEAADGRLVYTYTPATGTLDDFAVQYEDTAAFQPAFGGGLTAIVPDGDGRKTVFLRGGKAEKIEQIKETLKVWWRYDYGTKTLPVQWTFRLVGKALAVEVQCDEPVLTRCSLGDVANAPLRRTLSVPYFDGHLHFLAAQKLFNCRFFDWTVSHASLSPQSGAVYELKTDGRRNPLRESGYIAVSPHVAEVLPNLPGPASPYLAQLAPRIMLDIWGHNQGTYASDAENLRLLKDLGVDHVAIIQHDWQRFGYDVKLPDHIPANPRYGGDEGMKQFGRAANECGYLWSVHENYIDLYPDAPSYDATARVLKADSTPSPAWYNPGTRVQSYGLKCNRALEFARRNTPEIHQRYATTAGYLDVHTCVPPWHQLDHDASQPMAAMALGKVKFDTELFQFMRDTHRGPLFGEGHNQMYWAGRCDGVEAQVQGGEDHLTFLDFDLLKLHPQMVNHGMGYYERWFRGGYNHRLGIETGTTEQIDKYRAMEVAYGHAGFAGSPQDHNWHWVVREHHLVHPVQRLYGVSTPAEIRYEVNGEMVSASAALPAGATWRQRIRYLNGLTVWVNWQSERWSVEGRILPQWGFLALGPGTEVCTGLRGGRIADFVDCPEYLFADARTYAYQPYRRGLVRIEPRLKAFEYLGNRKARVTYEWIVGETVKKDYHCFVHGTEESPGNPEGITFQQDHALPKPTSQWRVGEVIQDGPYEFQIPDNRDAYNLTVGLYKDDRLSMQGLDDGGQRIVVARLKWVRNGSGAATLVAEPPAKAAVKQTSADFTAHLNPAGTMIDFGPLVTDGALKIQRGADQLTLFPYPRDQQFRVSLNWKTLVPGATAAKLKLTARSALEQKDLGAVPFRVEQDRLIFEAGLKGAGRYLLQWK